MAFTVILMNSMLGGKRAPNSVLWMRMIMIMIMMMRRYPADDGNTIWQNRARHFMDMYFTLNNNGGTLARQLAGY